MAKQIPVTNRASQIEYAIRDVVVPATALEADGHNIIKLNIGDPLAYPGLPTPKHMIEAYQKAIVNQKKWLFTCVWYRRTTICNCSK